MKEYNVGDIVYAIGYQVNRDNYIARKLTINKMKITKIIKDKDGTTYETDITTGLERENGGYTARDFYDIEDIEKEVGKFLKK